MAGTIHIASATIASARPYVLMSPPRVPHSRVDPGALERLGAGDRLTGRDARALLDDDQRPHHVVLFVLQDVAVPDVLVAARPRAARHGKWRHRQFELHDDRDHLAWVHADRFLPAPLFRTRSH